MLSIKQNKKHRGSYAIILIAVCLVGVGLYVLALAVSPSVAPLIFTKPINAKALPKAKNGEKSPFYNIDKMKLGDNIVVDYDGARYAYEITKIFEVKPNQVEIEAPSEEAKLTLYSCELGGSEAGRIVISGKLLGQVEQ